VTAFMLAWRFIGLQEIAGLKDHPFIVWALALCGLPNEHDETAWCSAFVNAIAWLLDLPRSGSASARSWLKIGRVVSVEDALPAFDVVVLTRGHGQPGADVLDAPGHVGFFAGTVGSDVLVLAGNQNNQVSIERFAKARILGVRRLEERRVT
jgi:uncharacterized protein (TIGR02594 family)